MIKQALNLHFDNLSITVQGSSKLINKLKLSQFLLI